LLKEWQRALNNGEVIHPFKDMVISPVPLNFVVTGLKRIIELRLPGIVQISGEKDITYADAAYYVADKIGARKHLVQPVNSLEAGIPAESAPSHTTLDTSRLRAELGLDPPDVWTTIDSMIPSRS
jgi:dTDP-4-dehydrorhamnose reductase